jgi:hypothetical protein
VVYNGAQKELYYAPTSSVIANVPKMLQITACFYFGLIALAILCISKKEDTEKKDQDQIVRIQDMREPLIGGNSS